MGSVNGSNLGSLKSLQSVGNLGAFEGGFPNQAQPCAVTDGVDFGELFL
jgi:hypothetical protein